MVEPERRHREEGGESRAFTERGFDPGGHVGQLHAEIAKRFATGACEPLWNPEEQRAERWIRGLSVVSGYVALLVGYVAAAAAVYRWF